VRARGAGTRRAWVRSAESGLAANRLVRKGFEKSLVADVPVPLPRKGFMLPVEVGHESVVLAVPVA